MADLSQLAAAFEAIGTSQDKGTRGGAEQYLVQSFLASPCAVVDAAVALAVQATDASGVAAATMTKRLVIDNWRTCSGTTSPEDKASLVTSFAQRIMQHSHVPWPVLCQLGVAFGVVASCEFSAGLVSQDVISNLVSTASNASAQPWEREHSTCLLHHFLKSGASRPGQQAAFAPVFVAFAPQAFSIVEELLARPDKEWNERLFVLAAKCAMRCAAVGSFNTDIVLRCVAVCSELMAGSGDISDRAAVTLNRLGKIVTRGIAKHCSKLGDSGIGEHFAGAILPLLCNATMPPSGRFPAKFVMRALATIQCVLTLAMSDEFLTAAVGGFFGSEAVVRQLVGNLVTCFLCDKDIEEEDWRADPERCVIAAELDEDGDDETHCAQQAWLAMLLVGGDDVSRPAWGILEELYSRDDEESKIGALHALGVAYDYLAEGREENFRFLCQGFMPLVNGEVPCSPKLLRRVVWVLGMWCFTITDPEERKYVHNMLAHVVTTSNDPVITLTGLRSIENYVTDVNFDQAELPANFAAVLERVGSVLPSLRDPDSVKLVVALLSSLMSKTDGTVVSFDSVIQLLAPVLRQYVDRTVDEDDRSVAACVGELTMALGQATAQCTNASRAWELLLDVAIFMTNPENTVSLMAAGEAWDLLFALVRSAPSSAGAAVAPLARKLLHFAVESAARDFEDLPTAMRLCGAIVLLLRDAGIATAEDAALAISAVQHLLASADSEQLLESLSCIVEASVALLGTDALAAFFQAAIAAAGRLQSEGASSLAFNAACCMLARCGQQQPQLWAGLEPGLLRGLLDALVEGHDEMTDEYQAKVIVNGAVAAVRAAQPAVGEELAGFVATMHESEGLREAHEEPPQQYATMWGDDGTQTQHQSRLAAFASSDPWSVLLPLA